MSYTNDPYHQQPDPQPFVNHPYPPRTIVPVQPAPPYGIEPLASPYPLSAPQDTRRSRRPSRLLLITAFAAVALASCGIGAALANSTASTPTSATVLPAVTVTTTAIPEAATPSTTAKPSATRTAPSATKATAKTVLSLHGSGIKNSAKFTTGANWTIHYTYNCAGFGGKGNFAVTTYTGGELDDVVVNDLGKKNDDTAPVYDDAGTHYLSINSECAWTIKVTV